MNEPLKYHPGEITIQQRANAFDPADLAGNGLGSTLDARAAAFLQLQRWALISGLDDHQRVWVSCLWGLPGFMKVKDAHALAVEADLPKTDPLAQRFIESEEIGMLVLDPATRRRTRINGRAKWEGRILHVFTREVYGNCPKYIQRRELLPDARAIPPAMLPGSTLTPGQRQWVTQADTFFIGTLHAEAGLDCSHRGGNPGFVQTTSPNSIVFPDYVGNTMFQTLGNLELDSRCGLLFMDFESGATLQLTGRAQTHWDPERLASWPGAQRLVEFQFDQVQETTNALPLRWRLLDYSPFNPKPVVEK